jgi:hypothetical protein
MGDRLWRSSIARLCFGVGRDPYGPSSPRAVRCDQHDGRQITGAVWRPSTLF